MNNTKKTMTTVLRFLKRFLIGTFLVSAFMVFTQDFQLFPGIVAGYFEVNTRDPNSLPTNITSKFVNTNDSNQLELWHLPANKISKDAPPIALIFHGNAENVKTTFTLQKWLSNLGIESFSFDYRGYGKSSGWPSDEGLKDDVTSILKYIEKNYDIDNRKIIFLGNSIGTGLATYAANLKEPDALILLAPYTSLKQLVSELPFFGFLSIFLWYNLNPSIDISKLKKSCLILAHGVNDKTIPLHHSQDIFNNATNLERKKIIAIENSGHNDLFAKAQIILALEIKNCLK